MKVYEKKDGVWMLMSHCFTGDWMKTKISKMKTIQTRKLKGWFKYITNSQYTNWQFMNRQVTKHQSETTITHIVVSASIYKLTIY